MLPVVVISIEVEKSLQTDDELLEFHDTSNREEHSGHVAAPIDGVR